MAMSNAQYIRARPIRTTIVALSVKYLGIIFMYSISFVNTKNTSSKKSTPSALPFP